MCDLYRILGVPLVRDLREVFLRCIDKRGRDVKDKFGRWNFEPVISPDGPPLRVGRGYKGDPVYLALGERGVEECRKYYEKGLRFLSGELSEPPSLACVVSAAIPHGSILKIAAPRDSAELDGFGPKALVSIKDEDRPAEKRRPRWFDPEFVPILILLISPGGSLRFNDSRPQKDKNGIPTPESKRRFFLSFGRAQEQNIRLLRVIADAPKGHQLRRRTTKSDREFHYDHRKNCLYLVRDDTAVKSGQPAGYSAKGREAAIDAAVEHFKAASKRRGEAALRHIADSPVTFERLLRHCFDVADRLHAEQTRRRELNG